MKAAAVCLFVLLTFAGCSLNTVRDGYQFTPEQAIAVARNKADQGQWSEALLLLDVVVSRYPEHAELSQVRRDLIQDFELHQQRWEDRLLVLRAQELANRIPVLEQMTDAEPLRLQVKWDLKADRREIAELRPKLLACGERQLQQWLHLASECVRLADWAKSDQDSRKLADRIALRNAEVELSQRNFEQRLDQVAKEVRAQQRAEQRAEQRKHRARARRSEVEVKLSRAEQRLSQSAYAEAALLIDQALSIDPKNQRARSLHRQLDRTLAHQRRLLDDLASRYYTEGDIEAAIRVWETLLQMSPGHKDIEERLERARRVRDKLSTVRAAGEREPQ